MPTGNFTGVNSLNQQSYMKTMYFIIILLINIYKLVAVLSI